MRVIVINDINDQYQYWPEIRIIINNEKILILIWKWRLLMNDEEKKKRKFRNDSINDSNDEER